MTAAILGLLILPPLASGAVIETQDWESLPAGAWGTPSGGFADNGPFVVDSPVGPSPSGGKVLRFLYPLGDWPSSVSGGRAGRSFAPVDEIYVGHWNYYSTNWVANHNGTKMDFLIWDTVNVGIANASIGFSGNTCGYGAPGGTTDTTVITPQIAWTSGGGVTKDFCNPGVQFPLGAWHWVEYRAVMNTPATRNGIFQLWINGELKASHDNITYREFSHQHFIDFIHTAEWGGGGGTLPSPNMFWLVDHTVLSTTQIGMPGRSGGDSAAPAAPRGLALL